MKKYIIFTVIGTFFGFPVGFAVGMYSLPIIIENSLQKERKKSPLKHIKNNNDIYYKTSFVYNAKGSDFFHRGQGNISISSNQIRFHNNVELTPGPDYKLYAVKKYVETEKEFFETRESASLISNIMIFKGQQYFDIPADMDINQYKALVIWCEAFKQFITVAKLSK